MPLSEAPGAPDVGVRAGDVLAGKYRVERVLGAGGMGVVVAAYHLQLEERVALKFLVPAALRNAEALARFDREARAAAKIKSEHVARVVDVGRLENGAPYLVMEYLEGCDLSGWVEQHGPLPVDLAVDFVLQACEAIAEAHSLGIVHRDLKPSNLFCIRRPDGLLSVKVLDFGISKLSSLEPSGAGADLGMTRTSAVIGSPFYMSPEQMQSSKTVDARTDVWALGVILFELLTGRVPFEADGLPMLAIKVATAVAPPLRAFRGDAPAGLEAAVRRCLEKDVARRYANVAELAADLTPSGSARARNSLETVSRVLRMAPAPAPLVSSPAISTGVPRTMSSWGQTGDPPRGRRGPVAAIAVGAAGLCAVLGAAVLLATNRPHHAATETPLSTAPSEGTAVPSAPPPPPSAAAAPPIVELESGGGTPDAAAREAGRPAVRVPVKPAPAKEDCDVPYYFDATGNRVFRKECL